MVSFYASLPENRCIRVSVKNLGLCIQASDVWDELKAPGIHGSFFEAMRPERQEEPFPDSQLRSVRCAGLRGSMARAFTELSGPRLKVG